MVEEEKGQVAKKGAKKVVKRAPAKGGEKSTRARKESYSIDIYKMMKQVHPDTGISFRAMTIMNSFVNDIFERIAGGGFLPGPLQQAQHRQFPGDPGRRAVAAARGAGQARRVGGYKGGDQVHQLQVRPHTVLRKNTSKTQRLF
ncbi:uncharacterized protein LOC132207481 [Stegostoma tigrinum]|uniref:uncharacterized protein LOC132207481 n=1 Tax=Stegostoma tigrinum TaxID=3053191 RepID=UPI002870793F|nr:uncharacterized protein LOC132207481 [Stegostoma tigrinum]